MMGHGIEIIPTTQIAALVEQTGMGFELEYFTTVERNSARSSPNSMQYLASRLAAKKIVIRVLNIAGDPDSLWYNIWHDIEIQRLPSGAPLIVLYSRCQDRAAERGITKWLLSLSHTPSYAAATAIAL